MLFCITANYTSHAINALMDNPEANRLAALSNLAEAAGGKVVSLYSTASEGPGVLAILDMPDLAAAASVVGIVKATGAIEDGRLMRLMTQDEVKAIRKKAAGLKSAYKAPGR